MGQKVRPTGFRVGIMMGWQSDWFASKQDFSDLLVEDVKIRKFIYRYLKKRMQKKEDRPGIAKIKIERTRDKVVLTIHTSRPGQIIGKKGENIDKLTAKLEDLTRRRDRGEDDRGGQARDRRPARRRGHRRAA